MAEMDHEQFSGGVETEARRDSHHLPCVFAAECCFTDRMWEGVHVEEGGGFHQRSVAVAYAQRRMLARTIHLAASLADSMLGTSCTRLRARQVCMTTTLYDVQRRRMQD